MSIIAIGACYVDTILTTSHYPQEDEKLRASTISRRRGGNCANTLEVLQQLIPSISPERKPSLDLVAVLPSKSSVASRRIIAELEPQVRLAHCIYREQFEEPASSYITKSQSSGSRTIVNYNELPEMTLEEFRRIADELGPEAKWFHFEGRAPDVTLSCIHYIREKFPSVRISVEVEKPGRSGLQELAAAADVVFYSKTWALDYGYNSTEQCLRQQSNRTHASLLCCTWGQEGAGGFEPNTGKFVHVAPETTENFQVVDPVGAGDTFIAGMLYALNFKDKQWDLATRLRFANQIAATKVSQEGFGGLHRVLASASFG